MDARRRIIAIVLGSAALASTVTALTLAAEDRPVPVPERHLPARAERSTDVSGYEARNASTTIAALRAAAGRRFTSRGCSAHKEVIGGGGWLKPGRGSDELGIVANTGSPKGKGWTLEVHNFGDSGARDLTVGVRYYCAYVGP